MIADQFTSGNEIYYLMNNAMRILLNKKILSCITTIKLYKI